MTTLATGGYSTSDQSMGRFGSDGVLWTGTVFMILASLPFVLYLESLRRGIQVFVRDDQVRFFFKMVLTVVVAGAAMLSWQQNLPAWDAVTVVAFNAVSTITTTGFASTDYTLWGEFFVAAFVFLMFTGGCSGSTAGSIKIFRLQIALHLFRIQIKKLIHPNGVFVARLNGERVSDDIVSAMVGFSLAMVLTVVLVTLALTALNVDFMTAMSSAATAITNVGPGVGPLVGPAGNFAALPDAAKWLLAGAMLLGRLELMTVLVLFSRSYWQG
jgi:trk system potassium uptake protein TrkH